MSLTAFVRSCASTWKGRGESGKLTFVAVVINITDEKSRENMKKTKNKVARRWMRSGFLLVLRRVLFDLADANDF